MRNYQPENYTKLELASLVYPDTALIARRLKSFETPLISNVLGALLQVLVWGCQCVALWEPGQLAGPSTCVAVELASVGKCRLPQVLTYN